MVLLKAAREKRSAEPDILRFGWFCEKPRTDVCPDANGGGEQTARRRRLSPSSTTIVPTPIGLEPERPAPGVVLSVRRGKGERGQGAGGARETGLFGQWRKSGALGTGRGGGGAAQTRH